MSQKLKTGKAPIEGTPLGLQIQIKNCVWRRLGVC